MQLSPRANLQLIYVSDIERSTEFYKMIFNCEPKFASPRYVAFPVEGEALFALWTGGEMPNKETHRYSEIGIMLKSNEEVDALYDVWKHNYEIKFVERPVTLVFGRTFVVKDPDGHHIRVCPLD